MGVVKRRRSPPEGTHSEPKSLIARAAVGAAVVVVIIVAALQSQMLLWRPTGHYVVLEEEEEVRLQPVICISLRLQFRIIINQRRSTDYI